MIQLSLRLGGIDMKEYNQEVKYFLALERMPGDYKFININDLNLGCNPHSLAEIDAFTMQYSKNDLLEAIKRVNIVEPDYLEGNLVIQDNMKHKSLPVIDKELLNNFEVGEFFQERITNKMLMNNINYKFSILIKDNMLVNDFKICIKMGNIRGILETIFKVEYSLQRKFMLYLLDLYHKDLNKEVTQNLVLDKN